MGGWVPNHRRGVGKGKKTLGRGHQKSHPGREPGRELLLRGRRIVRKGVSGNLGKKENVSSYLIKQLRGRTERTGRRKLGKTN